MNPNIANRRHEKAAQARQGERSERRHVGQHGEHQKINVGDFERQASMIGGTVLAAYGLLRGSFSGMALAAIGGAMIWRGHTGHCEVYQMLGHSSADQREGQQGGNKGQRRAERQRRDEGQHREGHHGEHHSGHESHAAGEV